MAASAAVPLLFLLASTAFLAADAGADELNYIVVGTSELQPSPVCKGLRVHPSANHTGSWVPLSRPHGPCSSSGADDDSAPSVVDLLRFDRHRADYIQRKLAGNVSQEDLGLSPAKFSQQSGTVQPSVGSPAASPSDSQLSLDPAGRRFGAVKQTMLLDTASDVAWLQCAPCPAPQCYPQADVLYDPTRSTSSATFPCASPACRRLGPYGAGCSSSSECQYRVQYPDGSSTTGTFGSDLLTLSPTTAVSNFQFGCSHAARGNFNNQTAGIMALGRGAQSLAAQTDSPVFSYCFPPTASHQGFLLLGVPSMAASRYALTPMLQSKLAPTLYLVRLVAIAVAGQRLAVPPAVFAAGAVMDTRTVTTRLPPTAYQALRAAFRDSMRMYRAAAPKGELDTCYDFAGVGKIALPKISLVFDRTAGVELDPSGVLLDGCLAFTSNRDDRDAGIIGNFQQQTLEVLFNARVGTVGFRRGAC